MSARREKLILTGIITAFCAAIFTIAWIRYHNFGYNGLDLAIYNHTFWNTVHGQWFASSIHPPSYLGDHAEWLILALAPFYAIIPHPLTLVALQALAIGVSAIPLWLIAKIKFTDAKIRLLFPFIWLANPIAWNLSLFEFHMIAFAVPLIFVAAYFFIKKKWTPYIATILLILLTREDMAFVVFGFALIAAVDLVRHRERVAASVAISSRLLHPRQARARNDGIKWVIVPIALAIAVFLIDQRVIAHFNPDGAYKYLTYYEWLGKTPLEILSNAICHPLKVILHLLKPQNAQIIFLFLLTVLFMPVFRPRWLLLCLPVAAEYALTELGMTGTIIKTQYSAAFIPAIMLAALEGYERLMADEKAGRYFPKRLLPVFLIIAAIYVWFYFGPGAGIAKISSTDNGRTAAMRQAMTIIPADAPVVSSMDMLASLSSRQFVWPMSYFWIGKKQFGTSDYPTALDPEYLILDQRDFIYFFMVFRRTAFWDETQYHSAANRFRAILLEKKYGSIFERDGIAVLKKNADGPWPFVARHAEAPAIKNTLNVKIGPLSIVGWEQDGLNLRLFFSADKTVEKEYALYVNKKYFPLGNGIYPTTAWQAGETVEVALPIAEREYAIALTNAEGGLGLDSFGGLFLAPDDNEAASETITIKN